MIKRKITYAIAICFIYLLGALTVKYKLPPNYNLKVYSDEDAAGSIDPIDVIRFYEQRGYKLIDKMSFLQRIFFNESSIYLKKEGTNAVANKA